MINTGLRAEPMDREHLEAAIWRVTRTRLSRTDVMNILAAADKYAEAEAQATALIAIQAERRRILTDPA